MKLIDVYKKEGITQFIKFCIIGVSNVVVSYIFYILVIKIGGHYILGNIVGYISGTLYAFFWNNRWVFKPEEDEKRSIGMALIKTLISYAGTGLVLNSILLVFWVRIIGVSQIIAPAINSVITVTINFLSNKFWVFRKNGEKVTKDERV